MFALRWCRCVTDSSTAGTQVQHQELQTWVRRLYCRFSYLHIGLQAYHDAGVQVSLYRSDALIATIELDKHMAITRIDDAIGLMMGVSARTLLKKNFPRYDCVR